MAHYRRISGNRETVEAVQVQVTKFVTTPYGPVLAHSRTIRRGGDWVVTVLHGRLCGDQYVCTDEVFAATFEQEQPPGNP